MKWKRIWGIMLRFIYDFNHSIDRWVDAFYWPALDIIVWGLTISAMTAFSPAFQLQVSMILSGIILWYILWRGQYEISVNILEEFWSGNLINFLGSPLKWTEWITALLFLSVIKLLMTFTFMTVLAFVAYSVNIFHLQFALLSFIFSLLLSGWIFGLFCGGCFLRYGTNIQTLGWAGPFILMPLSATFFPIQNLPWIIQKISLFVPSSYIFEGMRSILFRNEVPYEMILKSFLLNGVYLIGALYFFFTSFKKAKERGISHLK